MQASSNLKKYQSKNILKRLCLKIFINNILSIISKLPAKTMLDAGCGEGVVIKQIKNKRLNLKITGIDISAPSLALARKLLPDCEFKQGDILNLDFEKNAFDLVIALEVLEHLENPWQALGELKRVASKYCLISVPWEPFFSLGNLLSGKNIKLLGKDPEHLHYWNKSQITNLVNNYFNVIETKISFPWTIILVKKYG